MFEFLKAYNYKPNEKLSYHCTMRVGGNAQFYLEPKTIKQLLKVVKECQKNNIKYFILGNGSNVIFGDKQFKGVVICTKLLKKVKIKKNKIIAECGANLFAINYMLQQNNLGGMEWSYGIPGTVGGAVCMNAGAYGGQMKDVVTKVQIYDGKKIRTLKNKQIEFTYRDSLIKRKQFLVFKVWIKLKFENKEKIKEKQTYYFNRRKLSQPLETYNCGSVFKAVNGVSAGKIIDNLGLKGVKLNGAQISKLHANFIVNLGNATSEDVKELINLIKHKVKEQTGIDLEEEIIFVGD